MNVLILDNMHQGLDFALRCAAAGHHARLCLPKDKNGRRSEIGDGLVEKIEGEDWESSVKWADLIVPTDNTKWLHRLDYFRGKSYPVFGPSYEGARLELERGLGQQFLKKCGIRIADYQMFSDFSAARKHVLE